MGKTSPRNNPQNQSNSDSVGIELKGKHFKELAERFSSQIQVLNQRGFNQPRRNLIALKKNNGDIDEACTWLEKTSANRSNKSQPQAESIAPLSEELKGKHFQELAKKYSAQVEQLKQRGFNQPRRNLIALKKHNGDVQAACAWLNKKQNKPKKDSPDFNQLLAQLHAKGFYNDRKNLRLLHKAGGSLSQVLNQLESETS